MTVMGEAGSDVVDTVPKTVLSAMVSPVLPLTVRIPTKASVILLLRMVPLLPSMTMAS